MTTSLSQVRKPAALRSTSCGPYPWLDDLVLTAEQLDCLRLYVERTLQMDEEGLDQ